MKLSEVKRWISEESKKFKAGYRANFYAFDVNITGYDEATKVTEYIQRFRISELNAKNFKYFVTYAQQLGLDSMSITLCPETRESFQEEWDSEDYDRPSIDIPLKV